MSKIASSDGDLIFVSIQTVKGVMNKPTSSDTVYLTASPTVTQKTRLAENKEKRRTLDSLPPKACGFHIGDFKFQTHLVVSGTPGVLSCIHPLLLSAYGRHTVNTGTDVTYEHYLFDDDYVYLTILLKEEFSSELLVDCVVDTMSLKSVAAALQTVDWSGYFLTRYRAGTGHLDAQIDGTTTPVTSIVLETKRETEMYDVGAYINVGSDNNSGQGFKITGVDVDTKTLTIQDGVETIQDAGAVVEPWAPVDVAAGYCVDGGFGDFIIDENSEGAQPVQITTADYQLKNNIAKLEDERGSSTTGYTGRFGRAKREATFNTDNYLTIDNLSAEYHLQNQSTITIELNMGEETGKMAKIVMPNLKLTDVNKSGDAQKKQGKQGKCYPDAGDDPSKLILL